MKKTKPFLYLLVLITSIFYSVLSNAEQENDEVDLGGGFTEPEAWKEGAFTIPPYPQNADLIKVEVDRVDMPFDFYLDTKNISYSKDEGLIRYTVVIKSTSGASNVFFEGLRCAKREYRTYAYGTYEKGFVKAQISEWKYIEQSGFMAHRYNLYQYYMCDDRQAPSPVSDIIRRVTYPENFQVSDETSD